MTVPRGAWLRSWPAKPSTEPEPWPTKRGRNCGRQGQGFEFDAQLDDLLAQGGDASAQSTQRGLEGLDRVDQIAGGPQPSAPGDRLLDRQSAQRGPELYLSNDIQTPGEDDDTP